MKIPDYPSNREADEGAQATVRMDGKAPRQEEAKSGDLFVRRILWAWETSVLWRRQPSLPGRRDGFFVAG